MGYLFQDLSVEQIATDVRDREPYSLHLIAADFTLEFDLAALSAIEADYAGYAAKTLSGGVVEEVAAADKHQVRYALQEFVGPASGDPDQIYGYWVQRTGGPSTYLLVFKFDAPVTMGSTAHKIKILPQWRVGTLPNG